MTCGNCGRQNPPSALYCLDCGQKLRDAAPRPAPPPPAAPLVGQAPPAAAAAPAPQAAAAPRPAGGMEMCPRCGVENPAGMRFCRMCGGVMSAGAQPQPPASAPAPAPPIACPRCSAPVVRGAAFCGVCGLPASEMPGAAAGAPPAPAPAPLVAPAAQPPRPAAPSSPYAGGYSPPASPGFGAAAPFAAPEHPAAPAPASAPAPAPPPSAAAGMAPGVIPTPMVPPPQPSPPVPAPAGPGAQARPELRTDNYGADVATSTARLVTILKDGSEGPSYRVGAGTSDIGRTEGNILLQDDPYLSPRHARITFRNGRYYLRDLGSVNGVFYRLREPVVLQNGDVFLVGQQVMRLEMLTDAEVSLGPVMHYGVMVFGTPEQPRVARLVQTTTEGIPRDVFHLYREETVIGRESGDIVFTDDAFLSRRHAALRLERSPRRVSLRDLGSSNGTLVQFRGEREINDGDLFRIGHHLFRFDLAPRGADGGAPGR